MHLLAQSFGFDDVTVDTVEMVKEHNKRFQTRREIFFKVYKMLATLMYDLRQTNFLKPRNCNVKWYNKNTKILGGQVAIIGKNTFKVLKSKVLPRYALSQLQKA